MAAKPESWKARADDDLKKVEAADNKTAEPPKKRHRSPNYPAVGLREALDKTKKFYDLDGKAGAPAETAAKHIGFASAHGQALSVLAALKSFGLLEDKSGRVVPTQRAVELLHLPPDDPRRIEALQSAAVAPAIYRQLIQQYRDTGLPSDDTLRAELVAYKGFNPNAVEEFVRGFKETLEFSGLSDFSVLEFEPEMSNQETETAERSTVKMRSPLPAGIAKTPEGAFQVRVPRESLIPPAASNAWTWTLSIPRNVRAELRIAGDVTKADMVRLKKQIEFLEESFDESEEHQ